MFFSKRFSKNEIRKSPEKDGLRRESTDEYHRNENSEYNDKRHSRSLSIHKLLYESGESGGNQEAINISSSEFIAKSIVGEYFSCIQKRLERLYETKVRGKNVQKQTLFETLGFLFFQRMN